MGGGGGGLVVIRPTSIAVEGQSIVGMWSIIKNSCQAP